MKRRVFASIFFASFITLLLSSVLITALLRADSTEALRSELINEAEYISISLRFYDNPKELLAEIGKDDTNRITLIASDGTVIYDNFAPTENMENHLARPEVQDALKNGTGESIRNSGTLGDKNYYYAIKLSNSNILRISTTSKSLLNVFGKSVGWIVLIFLSVLAVSFLLASLLTKSIVDPINKIDLDGPFHGTEYDELSPLLLRMEKQKERISRQINELTSKQRELEHITNGMSEAMVIFGSNGVVLSANRSARDIFDYHEGASYLKLCRDIEYIKAVEKALAGNSESIIYKHSGRLYSVTISPVGENSDNYAAVLFASDITEKEENEKMRREFSANVSHELKTPLTSIMGYAEIIRNGIAKPGDIPRFANQIHSEASRLLHLIEDIIRLSMLDEKDIAREFAPVNLLALSEIVKSELALKAKEKNVAVSVEGDSVIVSGINSTLHEMLFNLCDNAIAYNKPGGSVNITVSGTEEKAILSVSDTGVGIAPEHQERIFERFYRVDKSHSKETGGTGLGLSIVKHGAKLHGAYIELESTLGKGTDLRIIFDRIN